MAQFGGRVTSSRAPGASDAWRQTFCARPCPRRRGAGWVPRDARAGGAGARLAPCAATENLRECGDGGISSGERLRGTSGRWAPRGRRRRGQGPRGVERISKSASGATRRREEKTKIRGARDARGTHRAACNHRADALRVHRLATRPSRARRVVAFLEAQTRSEPPSRALPFARPAVAPGSLGYLTSRRARGEPSSTGGGEGTLGALTRANSLKNMRGRDEAKKIVKPADRVETIRWVRSPSDIKGGTIGRATDPANPRYFPLNFL